MSEVNKAQIGGEHYKKHKIQHWDWVVANHIPYLEACATKYVVRHKDKGGREDLEKAKHYIDKIIEIHYGPVEKPPQLTPISGSLHNFLVEFRELCISYGKAKARWGSGAIGMHGHAELADLQRKINEYEVKWSL